MDGIGSFLVTHNPQVGIIKISNLSKSTDVVLNLYSTQGRLRTRATYPLTHLKETMMSPQRYRHLLLTLSCLLLSSSKSTLMSRGKVRRAQETDESRTGITPEDIEKNFQPDHDFSVSDAAASLLRIHDAATIEPGNDSLVVSVEDYGSTGLDPER